MPEQNKKRYKRRLTSEMAPHVDYYAVLNVPREASQEEVRKAYFALSRALHPDKQPGGSSAMASSLRAAANDQFSIIDRAYKVLSDPIRREAYDTYGEEALKALDMDQSLEAALVRKAEQGDGILYELESLLLRNAQHKLEAKIGAHGGISMDISAVELLRNPLRESKKIGSASGDIVEVTQMMMQQAVEAQWSRKDRLSVGGYMVNRNGIGFGNITLSNRRQFSASSWGDLGVEFGHSLKVSGSACRQLTKYTTGLIGANVEDRHLQLKFLASRKLFPGSTGQIEWAPGPRGHMGLDFVRKGKNSEFSSELKFGSGDLHGSMSLIRNLTAKSRAKVSVRVSRSYIGVEVSGARTLSERSRMNIGVSLSLQGVHVKFRYSRGGMRYNVPVLISPWGPSAPMIAVVAAVVPISAAVVVKQAVKPYQKERRSIELAQERALRQKLLRRARHNARMQQQLMARVASNKTKAEREKQGLIILEASYGSHVPLDDLKWSRSDSIPPHSAVHDGDSGPRNQPTAQQSGHSQSVDDDKDLQVDVTVPLQFYVKDSSLHLLRGPKCSVLGFYNPMRALPVELQQEYPPKLFVRYQFGDTIYEASFEEEDEVLLPSNRAREVGPVSRIR